MAKEMICYRPIGVIRSPFTELAGMPIQAVAGEGVTGQIELLPEFAEGLADIEGFSHLILIYELHLMEGYKLSVTPYLDDQPHGIFATRSPKRPNPIGLSIVRLTGVDRDKAILEIEGIDIVDGTPLLDIKPYVPYFDNRERASVGWFADRLERVHEVRADQRFQAASGTDAQPTPALNIQENNKRLIAAYFADLNAGRLLETLDHYLAEDVINYSAPPEKQHGIANWRRIMTRALEAMSDLDEQLVHMVAEGELVVAHSLRKARWLPPDFRGVILDSATSRTNEVEFMRVFRVVDGKIVEYWSVKDDAAMARQLGVEFGKP